MLPEYDKKGCMGCHGGTRGESIHAGKIPGCLHEPGGAISVIFQKAPALPGPSFHTVIPPFVSFRTVSCINYLLFNIPS